MFEANGITYSIGAKSILSNVSLRLVPGEVIALLGPNGAGKSTLLKTMSGDIKPVSGEVVLEGKTLKEWSYHELARKRAVLAQHSKFDFPFSAREVVLLGRNPHIQRRESRRDFEIVDAALKVVEAAHLAGQSFPTMSGGEQQRIHLARVLAQIWEAPENGGRYLFLDEPISSLDLAHQHLTLQTARNMANNNTAVLMVLHDLNLAAQYADRILIMRDGQEIAFDTPANILTSATIRSVFGIDAHIAQHPTRDSIPLIVPIGKIGHETASEIQEIRG